jgi:choline dehydrogenase
MSQQTVMYDFIVVGAGTAGSVVAARLSEDPNIRILLLEAGGAPPKVSAHPPAWPTLLRGEADWGDMTSVQPAIGRAAPFARGRAIGGSSTINAMVFARGHRESYASWRHDGEVAWSFDDLLPYFKRSETAPHGDPALRGVEGPMVVAPAHPPNPVLVACLCAALQCGYPRAADVSGGLDVGFGFADLNIVQGKRQSAADAYLQPAMLRPNLEIVPNALVHRLNVQGGRCTSVEFQAGTTQSLRTAGAGEIILAAGAIGSPHILMVSGIGPHQHLQDVGVNVIHDLPGVGSNLHDHPIVPLVYRAARPLPPAQHNHGELLGLIRTTPAVPHFGPSPRRIADGAPDLQIFGVDSADVPGLGGSDGFVLGVSVLQPFSRGSVRLSGTTLHSAPVIDPNYLADGRDMRTLIEGMQIARKIGTAQALDAWRAEEIAPGARVIDDAEMQSYIREVVASYFHPVGTCAMGNTPQSVVDSQLRVHGISGLRVVDASVMPTIPSNNTAATVYAIAERAVDLIRVG